MLYGINPTVEAAVVSVILSSRRDDGVFRLIQCRRFVNFAVQGHNGWAFAQKRGFFVSCCRHFRDSRPAAFASTGLCATKVYSGLAD